MALAIFDLDHTLINGDSDYLWGEYMVANKIVDADVYQRENKAFLDDYLRGDLDNETYLKFALKPLTQYPIDRLHAWRSDYVSHWIKPIVAKGTQALLDKHRAQGDELIIISATNLFITAPIAELLGIDQILSTEPEIIDNQYTGRYLGTPTFKEGKVTVLNKWLKNSNHSLSNSYFYSDSINDLPLLQQVKEAVVVDGAELLVDEANRRKWKCVSLR